MKSEDKAIYDLELHETLTVYTEETKGNNQDTQRFHITRVAGGWIYSQVVGVNNSVSQIFVPFDNEFQNK